MLNRKLLSLVVLSFSIWAGDITQPASASGVYCNATGGATNILVCTPSPAVTSYTNLLVSLKVDAANTGATTINISGVGALNLYYNGAALTSVGLLSLCINGGCAAYYDGTEFNLIIGVPFTTTGGLSTVGTGNGTVTVSGSTSGSAAIAAPAIAGTPSTDYLPTTDCGTGPCLMESATPSAGFAQLSWSSTVTGTGAPVLGTSPTLATPVIASLVHTGTITTPSTSGGMPIVIACGTTSGATANCSNTAVGSTSIIYFGKATLSSNASIITISPGYTSSSTYFCTGNDVTTRANAVQVVPTSATTFTITDTTGVSDGIQWICAGY